jgi:hypothetical protein
VFERDEVREVLRATFFRPGAEAAPRVRAPRRRPRKDEVDYEVICISLYKDDLARLDEKVQQLKRSGHRKMSRSALIRFALDSVDTGKLPRSY